MRKFFLAIFAILLIAFGIYGLDYFSKLKQAKQDLSEAVLSLNERQYDDAVEKLKLCVNLWQAMRKVGLFVPRVAQGVGGSAL